MYQALKISLIFSALTIVTHAKALEFSLRSKDGLSQIHGQVDIPQCSKIAYPAVLMVSGTGLFSRNAYFGRSRTERDLLFLDLAKKLNDVCIATVRFDNRGVSCDLKSKSDLKVCVDQHQRANVTDQTMLDDIQIVYDFAIGQSLIDKQNLVLLGHSEGSLNISRLIARKSIVAKAIMFLGGVSESAKSILKWQISERPAGWIKNLDLNHDRNVTNEEIRFGFSNSPLNDNYPLASLLSSTGSWSFQEIDLAFEEIYQAATSEALGHKKSDVYLQSGIVFTSYQWWQRWFTDDVSVLENLKEFSGPIEYHNGDIDSQAPGIREQSVVESGLTPMKSRPTFVLHPGKGHGLGRDPLYGPLDEDIASSVVKTIGVWVN